MAPIGHSIVPFRFRDSFFRDPYFADSWDVIERQRRQFDRDCEEAHQRVFGRPSGSHSLLDSSSVLAPRDTTSSSLSDYFKNTSGSNEHDFKTEKDSYKVVLDVQQFKPEELCVKTSDDNNTIIIEGKHEEKKEDSSHRGYIARQFTRKYTLPSDVKLDQLQCNLSSDGVLQVTAPRTLPSITDGKVGEQNGNTTTSTSAKRDSSERMTVDGRKVENATTESKYDNYAKWKESRAESPVFDNADRIDNLTSSKTNSDQFSNGTTSKSIERIHKDNSSLISRMQNWDPFFHALPDFDMVPFWKRRFNSSRLLDRDDEQLFGIQSDLDNFKVLVDAKQFAPEELSVRCTDAQVIIEGKHEDKEDSHGFISRHFTRKYDLPKGVKAEDVQCNLTAAGILEIKAPKPRPTEALPPIGRRVPILKTGNATNGVSNGTQSHKVSSIFEERKERSAVSSPFADEHTHRINVAPSHARREESVESTTSNANNRRVTIQELSRSSSANSNYNDLYHNRGEHVIPITIAAN